MRKTIVLVVSCALAIAAVASAQTKITFCAEGFTGGVGVLSEAIAGYKTAITNDADADAKLNDTFRLNFWTAVDKILTAQGIQAEGVDWGWAEPLIQKEVNAMLAKNGADVFVGETQMPGFAAKGYLEPFPADLVKKIQDKVVTGAYTPLMFNGKMYGLTFTPGVSVLFWNKDLVKQAGLNPDKAPATWDEFLSNLATVDKAGKGQYFGGGVYCGPNYGGSLRYYGWILENGGSFVDKNMNPTINSAANISTVQFLRKMAKSFPAGVVGDADEGSFFNVFNQSKIAYIVDGPWRKATADQLKMNVGWGQIPLPKASSKPVSVGIGMAMFGVPTYSKNKAAAFKFIEAMADKTVQDTVVDSQYRPAVLKAYASDSSYMSSYIGQFYKAFQTEVQGLPTFAGNQNAKIWDIAHQAITQAVVTDGDIKSILDSAQKQALALK